VREPVILHWLGEMFDPALAGYWAARTRDPTRARDGRRARVIERNARRSTASRSRCSTTQGDRAAPRLPRGVRMYTGDDFNFAALIGGDAAALRRAARHLRRDRAAASAALTALAQGDRARFDAILAPTVPLSRHVFAAPTRFYKTASCSWRGSTATSRISRWSAASRARAASCISRAVPLADAAGCCATRARARAHAHAARAARLECHG
jgi:hypothetical protein